MVISTSAIDILASISIVYKVVIYRNNAPDSFLGYIYIYIFTITICQYMVNNSILVYIHYIDNREAILLSNLYIYIDGCTNKYQGMYIKSLLFKSYKKVNFLQESKFFTRK